MTKEDWRKREEQWKRFHTWEAEHSMLSLTPEERLAEVGALADLVLAARKPTRETADDLRAMAKGIFLMHQGLACLGGMA